jgi:hypothetical protein
MNTDHDSYDSATEAFLHCKEFLEEREELTAAACLEGLDALDGPTLCRVAHSRLVEAQRRTCDASSKHFVTLALNAVNRAIGLPAMLSAG